MRPPKGEVIHYKLKYAKGKNTDERVQRSIGSTTLHKIVVVYRGMEMAVCEEV